MPDFSRRSLNAAYCEVVGIDDNVSAIRSAFNSKSVSIISSAFCPSFNPPSKADSTLTLNHDSIDRVKKFTETKYTIKPGITAISVNEMTRRIDNRLPMTSVLIFLNNFLI